MLYYITKIIKNKKTSSKICILGLQLSRIIVKRSIHIHSIILLYTIYMYMRNNEICDLGWCGSWNKPHFYNLIFHLYPWFSPLLIEGIWQFCLYSKSILIAPQNMRVDVLSINLNYLLYHSTKIQKKREKKEKYKTLNSHELLLRTIFIVLMW